MLNSFYEDLQARGLIKQSTSEELKNVLSKESVTLYAGFDPTADSLHVGSLLPLITLRRFQKAGHKPIALVGGATGLVGDPSFKATERSLLDQNQLDQNLLGISKQIQSVLEGALVVNNADWFKSFSYLGFLRDVGKHFSVNQMMGKESVRARLEDRDHGISYTEFSYMLLQAYDFYYLHKHHHCRLQIGGSDQWGNITAGTELIRRMDALETDSKDRPEVFGMTMPLLLKSDGTKFGKSESGNVWLDSKRTSPYEFYQFFLRTEDADVGMLLRFLTFLEIHEIEELEKKVKSEPEKRDAQKKLAESLTTLIHGKEETEKAIQASSALFQGGSEDAILSMDATMIKQAFSSAPTKIKSKKDLDSTMGLLDLLVEAGFCSSKGAARRDVEGGGISLNQKKVSNPQKQVTHDDLLQNQFLLLRKGKKNYFLFQFED